MIIDLRKDLGLRQGGRNLRTGVDKEKGDRAQPYITCFLTCMDDRGSDTDAGSERPAAASV